MKVVVAEGATSGKPAWWLLDDAGRRLAWSGRTFAASEEALAACRAFKAGAVGFRFEVYLDGRDESRWRVRDERGVTIALASNAFANRSLSVTDAHAARTGAGSAAGP
ncbi:MAG: hypothetical protein H7287_13155 [Thermoleophilia bacterium]|nr:hypothetical protein [Thermoleophilia bacterium]